MKKQLFLAVALCVAAGAVNAQKVKIQSGDLAFLKGQKEIKIEYNYKDLRVGKISEEEYYAKKQKDAKEPAEYDKFKEGWVSDRANRYEPKFEELFNKYMNEVGITGKRDAAAAQYIMEVKTINIEPGFNIGITRQPADVDYEISFKEIASGKVMAVLTAIGAPGNGAMGYDFDAGLRISEAYAKCGKSVSNFVIKKGELK